MLFSWDFQLESGLTTKNAVLLWKLPRGVALADARDKRSGFASWVQSEFGWALGSGGGRMS